MTATALRKPAIMADNPGNATGWWVGIGGMVTAILTFLGTRFTSRNDLVATLIKDMQTLRGELKEEIKSRADESRAHSEEIESQGNRLNQMASDLSAERRTAARLREEIKTLTDAHKAKEAALNANTYRLEANNTTLTATNKELRATVRAVLQDLVMATEMVAEENRAPFAERLTELSRKYPADEQNEDGA